MFAFSAYMPHVRYILTNWWKQFFFVKMIGEKTAFSIGRVVSSGAFRISYQLSRHHRPDTSFYVLYLVSLYKTKKKKDEKKEKKRSKVCNCIVPVGFLSWKIRVAFPGESQLRQSRATQPTVHVWCLSVSVIHRTLTWNTGSLTCAHM